jgi:23S rRNA pseudouridine1911/1915/1917 synthase
LHAAWLQFRHPVSGKEIDIRSPLPEDLRRALAATAQGSLPALAGDLDPLEYFGFYRLHL